MKFVCNIVVQNRAVEPQCIAITTYFVRLYGDITATLKMMPNEVPTIIKKVIFIGIFIDLKFFTTF